VIQQILKFTIRDLHWIAFPGPAHYHPVAQAHFYGNHRGYRSPFISGTAMFSEKFTLDTTVRMEMVDITDTVQEIIDKQEVSEGYCYLFNPHTTAGLTINEGADPDVKSDIIQALRNIVPMNIDYRHREGNSPSHVMASLIGSSLTLAIKGGRLQLGTWQRLFFCEFDGPRTRKVQVHLSHFPHP
jgi:secondary thiamine-phosphate synthase enzyme